MALEAEAVVQVLLRERLRLVAIATAVLHRPHDADDVFQQVVLSALEFRAHFRDAGHVVPWAVRAARFRAVDLARQRRLRPLPAAVLDRLEARWADPLEAGLSDQARALHDCLDRLPEPARELLRLRYADGLSAAAVAGRLRRTVDAVYQHLSRTHRALRGCVERALAAHPFAPRTSLETRT